ncbi:MAG: transposase [Pseudanabaenaceae cyanobacterium SKYGB_i_bin29]|nr:transposase [Pseudanabaenaceae cyanobacterium SKYG29]MDW8422252.1 transposase [Pseudanabaenaceae cyanobacterium SKYGB_i_bin29]
MLVRESKLKGAQPQYQALDEAIRTAQFVRNKCLRHWMDNQGVNKAQLYKVCKELAQAFAFAKKLNSTARQASAERAWSAISRFYIRCRNGEAKKGYPKFQKHCRSVEYKQSGWKLSPDGMSITLTDGFQGGTFALYCNAEARADILRFKINRVRIIRRADGYYAQFVLDADRQESVPYTGQVIGLDLGLKYFYADQHGNTVEYHKFLRRTERRLKQQQRRLSRKYRKGKQQSKHYHKQRKRLGRVHLKVQRQRKDWAIKLARCVVMSNDIVVYEDLQIRNMVKNRHLAKSIHDAAWGLFTQWLDYFGKLWHKVVIAVPPHYTSQDCSECGYRVQKTLNTRTHTCPNCGFTANRDQAAAMNIVKRGLAMLGANGTFGQKGTALQEGTLGEINTAAREGQPELVSVVAELRTRIPVLKHGEYVKV